jgi:hypothetical protein
MRERQGDAIPSFSWTQHLYPPTSFTNTVQQFKPANMSQSHALSDDQVCYSFHLELNGLG